LPLHRVSTPAHAHHDLFSQRSDTPEIVISPFFSTRVFSSSSTPMRRKAARFEYIAGSFFDCLWDSVAYLERNAGWMDLRKKWLAGWFLGRLACVCLSTVTRPCRYCFFCFPPNEHLVEVEAMEGRLYFVDELAGWFSYDFLHEGGDLMLQAESLFVDRLCGCTGTVLGEKTEDTCVMGRS